jgi:hypothetical protein
MTYMVGGKRSIVVAVSGRQHPGELVALALPQSIRIRQTGSSRVV